MTLIELLAYIDANINTKTGTDKILGKTHNAVLHQVVNGLIDITGTGFGGDINPGDDPGEQSNPIYFLAAQTGTFTYCAGLVVTALPAFIIWDGSSWKLNQIGIPSEESEDTGLRGLARSGDPEPSNPQVGDWYVYISTGELAWPGPGITKPGIIILDSVNPTNSWVPVSFGKESSGGAGLTDDQLAMLESFTASFSFSGLDSFPICFGRKVKINSITKADDMTELRVGKNGTAPTDITSQLPLTIETTDNMVFEATYNKETDSNFTLIGVKL